MAGNSQRRGAVRKGTTKKGMTVGSGGQRRRGLEGKGPTPKANERPNHKAYKSGGTGASGGGRPSTTGRSTGGGQRGSRGRSGKASSEIIAGRNSVLEALRAHIPASTMFVARNGKSARSCCASSRATP